MTSEEADQLLEGLTNEISCRRLVRTMIDKYKLPDGTYDLGDKKASVEAGVAKIELQFTLPEDREIKHGTQVIGGQVDVKMVIQSMMAQRHMNLEIMGMFGPLETEKGSQFYVYGQLWPTTERAGSGVADKQYQH